MANFKVNQYIVKKANIWEIVLCFPTETKKQKYGVFQVLPYKFDGIEYKCYLKPVGRDAAMFEYREKGYYTSDLSDIIPKDMVFNDLKNAQSFADYLNND